MAHSYMGQVYYHQTFTRLAAFSQHSRYMYVKVKIWKHTIKHQNKINKKEIDSFIQSSLDVALPSRVINHTGFKYAD